MGPLLFSDTVTWAVHPVLDIPEIHGKFTGSPLPSHWLLVNCHLNFPFSSGVFLIQITSSNCSHNILVLYQNLAHVILILKSRNSWMWFILSLCRSFQRREEEINCLYWFRDRFVLVISLRIWSTPSLRQLSFALFWII